MYSLVILLLFTFPILTAHVTQWEGGQFNGIKQPLDLDTPFPPATHLYISSRLSITYLGLLSSSIREGR